MLQRLFIKNFTVFAEADFVFGPGLNVVVGTNGTGKSHVLKLGYAVLSSLVGRLREMAPRSAYQDGENKANSPAPRRPEFWQLEDKLRSTFRPSPNEASELIRRGAAIQEAVVIGELLGYESMPERLVIRPNISVESPLQLTPSVAQQLTEELAPPVLIPAKEILTLGWMRPASVQLKLPLDEAYLDLLTQLSGLPLQKPEPAAAAALQQLTRILGGEVEEDNGRFYLVFPKEKRLEMNMVAEGLRKFGTLQKLLANGSLTRRTTLFWDEPESNLNPALLKKLAAILAELARHGFQIVLATHSLFLLKEFHIQARQQHTPVKYFGLTIHPDKGSQLTTTDDLELLPDISALDAEMELSNRFQEVLDQEDADDN